MKKVLLFGASGSIGQSTIELVQACPDQFQLVGMSAGRRFEALQPIAQSLGVNTLLDTTKPLDSQQIAAFIAQCEPDIVLNAVSGFAGLPYTIATLELGLPLALANKESLVAAGTLVMTLSQERKAPIIPVDSEHSAIWQCLANDSGSLKDFQKIYLTCSGGPFFGQSDLSQVTRAQALKHPNWDMGAAITIDSATLANKCLEFFEAMHLFAARADQIEIVVHPQSVVHSMVQFPDSSILAQLSPPDMKLPIAYALNWPERKTVPLGAPDFRQLDLSFRAPDKTIFKTLQLLERCVEQPALLPIVFNAANEVARTAFLQGQIRFVDIFTVIEQTLDQTLIESVETLEKIYAVDALARKTAQASLANL